MKITHDLVQADNRLREARIWDRWMYQAAAYADRYYTEAGEDDPFAYNEAASVSHLSSAAALAGYLGLAEWSTEKNSRLDGRKRSHGRSDFWLFADGVSWSFEFKQIRGGSIGPKRLSTSMQEAISCAKQTRKWDADCAVAGLIISLAWWEDVAERKKIRTRIYKFIEENKDKDFLAWLISGPDEVADGLRPCETFLIFDIVKRF